MKTCSKCSRKYPATTEYFYKDRDCTYGLSCWCKKCSANHRRKYYQEHVKDAKRYHKKYYKECGEGRKQYSKRYRKEHAEKCKEDGRKYRETMKGCLIGIYYHAKDRCKNPEHKNYNRYGGRGIKNKFRCFNDFYDYVINVLKVEPRGKQIHRIDNDGHYEKGNIEFLSDKEHRQKHKEMKGVN